MKLAFATTTTTTTTITARVVFHLALVEGRGIWLNGARIRNDDDGRTRGLLVGFAGGGGNGACICNDDEITARAVCRLVLVKKVMMCVCVCVVGLW